MRLFHSLLSTGFCQRTLVLVLALSLVVEYRSDSDVEDDDEGYFKTSSNYEWLP